MYGISQAIYPGVRPSYTEVLLTVSCRPVVYFGKAHHCAQFGSQISPSVP